MVKGRNGNHPSETIADQQNKVYIGVLVPPRIVVEGMLEYDVGFLEWRCCVNHLKTRQSIQKQFL